MYKSFYGLAEEPFNLTPDSKFLFMSRRHEEALQALLYGINHRKGFICLTGEIGSGKTTTLRRLLAELDKERVRAAIILNSYLNDLELLKTINEEFGLSGTSDSKKELLDELNAFLVEQYREGNNCVLIIDEAQNLKPETLEQIRMISNLETETDKLIQIVLVGQPELRRTLALPELEQLNQRITVRYHVTPLDENEVLGYISHRLRVAKAQVNVEFEPQAIRLIFHYSRGIPRRINVICDHALLVGYVMSSYAIDGDMVQQAVNEVRGEAGTSLEASEVAAEAAPRRSYTRPLVSAGVAVGVVAMIAAAIWFGGEIKTFIQRGAIGWVSPVSALTSDRDDAGERHTPLVNELPVPAERPDVNALDEATRAADPKEPQNDGASDSSDHAASIAVINGFLPVASGGESAGRAAESPKSDEPKRAATSSVRSAPSAKSATTADTAAQKKGSRSTAISALPKAVEENRSSRRTADREVASLSRRSTAPTPVGPVDLLLSEDLHRAAEKAAGSEGPKPWSYDDDNVLRVALADHAAPAAYLNLLRLWKIEVDLEPFAEAPADQVALYDMPAMVRQLDFETCQTNVLSEALALDVPMLVRLSSGPHDLGPIVAVRRIEGDTLHLLDPMKGLRRIKKKDFEQRVLEVTVLFRDPNGWTGLETGDRGKGVEALQQRLIELGYLAEEIDGRFGPKISEAIRKFQAEHNLLETGRVDAMTAARISTRSDLSRPRLTT